MSQRKSLLAAEVLALLKNPAPGLRQTGPTCAEMPGRAVVTGGR